MEKNPRQIPHGLRLDAASAEPSGSCRMCDDGSVHYHSVYVNDVVWTGDAVWRGVVWYDDDGSVHYHSV